GITNPQAPYTPFFVPNGPQGNSASPSLNTAPAQALETVVQQNNIVQPVNPDLHLVPTTYPGANDPSGTAQQIHANQVVNEQQRVTTVQNNFNAYDIQKQ